MIGRRTSFISLLFTEDYDPYVGNGSATIPTIGQTWRAWFWVYSTSANISSAGIATWQKQDEGADAFSNLADGDDGGDVSILVGSTSGWTGSLNKALVELTIADFSAEDYGVYRLKATGSEQTRYSALFLNNP